jgi:TRAP-type C4-dicarboxylate transport system substrate-binding protein
MKKRSFLSLFLALALVMSLGLAGCSKDSQGEKAPAPKTDKVYELSLATFSNKGGGMDLAVETPFIEKLEKASNGRIKITPYYSGALAAGDGIYDALVSGAADIGHFCTADYTGTFPLSRMFDLPGTTFNSSAAASNTYYDFVTTKGSEEYAKVQPLLVWGAGPNGFISSEPITKMEDLKGMQIAATGAMAPMIKAFGAIPVTLKFEELYEGLRLNMYSAVVNVPAAITDFNLAEVANYSISLPLIGGSGIMAMNKEVYASLPEDLQKIVDDVSREVFEEGSSTYFDVANKTALEAAMKNNPDFKVFKFSDEDLQKMEAKTNPIIEAYAKELDAKGLPGTEVLAWIREKTKEYNDKFATSSN